MIITDATTMMMLVGWFMNANDIMAFVPVSVPNLPAFTTYNPLSRSFFSSSSSSSSSTCKTTSTFLGKMKINRVQMLMAKNDDEFVEAKDGEALQELFLKKCDEEGFMSKQAVQNIPVIAQLLKDKDLLMEEFDEIWEAAPKFPLQVEDERKNEKIDVDSFIQIYRDIDDLFEDDEEDDDVGNSKKLDTESKVNAGKEVKESDDEVEDESADRAELKVTFQTLTASSDSDVDVTVSKETLRAWEEIEQLISEGMLGEEEFEVLWERTTKIKSDGIDSLDMNGFMEFNDALDELFVFEDADDEESNMDEGTDTEAEEEEEEQKNDIDTNSKAKTNLDKKAELKMVVGDDLPPGVIFAELADNDFLVGMGDLQRWTDLVSLIDDGELLPLELQNMFASIPKASGTTDKLNEEGFIALYETIDALFEDVDDDVSESKKDLLLEMIAKLDDSSIDDEVELLPCGLDSTEKQQAEILEIVTQLEAEPQNVCLASGGKISMMDLAGSWDLLYTSSSMMKFNKGLTGLGGSFPNGKFGGLGQKLIATKYITDVEYVERINVIPEANSFDARVNGDWELKSSVSLFTGAPSTILSVEPDKVMYGPTTTRADHWKSVRSMNLLDLSYLDDDLRIMRGNTSTDTLFIFRRSD